MPDIYSPSAALHREAEDAHLLADAIREEELLVLHMSPIGAAYLNAAVEMFNDYFGNDCELGDEQRGLALALAEMVQEHPVEKGSFESSESEVSRP